MKTRRVFALATALLMLAMFLPAAVAANEYTAQFGAQFDDTVNPDVNGWELGDLGKVMFSEGEATTLTMEFDAPVKFGGAYAAIETDFPYADGVYAALLSIKLDGAELPINAQYINQEGLGDPRGVRVNIRNEWNGDIPAQPVELGDAPEFTKLEVTFIVGGQPPTYTAQFGAQFDDTVNPDVNGWELGDLGKVTFTDGVAATLTMEFDAPVKFGGAYAAIETDFPYADTVYGELLSIKLDGAELPINAQYINQEGLGDPRGVRVNIRNEWNGDIAEQPVELNGTPEFTKLEVTFIISASGGQPPPPPPQKPAIPAFDPNGTYKAYLGIQSENWIFRDGWNTAFGLNGSSWDSYDAGNNFFGLSVIRDNQIVKKDGTFTDAVIAGNGTYRVSLTGFDFESDTRFRQLYVSTDIPGEAEEVIFTDVQVYIGNRVVYTFAADHLTQEGGFLLDWEDYYDIFVLNDWNAALGGEAGLFGYSVPTEGEIYLEFTVEGFAYDNGAEPPASPGSSAPGAASPSPSDGDGDGGGLKPWVIGVIIGGVVVAGGVVVLLVLKGKKN
ncbi:MAG: hypothetical protein LBI44_05195 [Oscillospiraceae bacterium]|jgi:hypothetical protein|nr:hypothetical protein [Oscillospiraceae bacterium]